MRRVEPGYWQRVWLTEAVRIVEEAGPLDDAQVIGRAQRGDATPSEKIMRRGWLLAERLGWVRQIGRLRDSAWVLLLAMAGAVLALANGLVFSVLADGRSINAASGFVSALGFHAATLLLWLISIAWARVRQTPGSAGLSMGRWFIALVARLPAWRGPETAPLAEAARQCVARERLAPWVFGLVSHLVWSLGFAFMLVALLLAFAFREYQLTWETTLLGPEWFTNFARATGYLPGLLGLPVPALDGTATGAAARAGAWPAREAAVWLLACVALYGLVPRLLCAIWCGWVVRRAARRIAIDLSDPYYQQLLARFQALEPAEVTDPESAPGVAVGLPEGTRDGPHAGFAVVGFELPADVAFVSGELRSASRFSECIAGTMQEQMRIHAQLMRVRPQRLLIVCNVQASPDRGTLRFLREARLSAEHCALALSKRPAAQESLGSEVQEKSENGIERWRTWLHSNQLADWPVFEREDAAERWALCSAAGKQA